MFKFCLGFPIQVNIPVLPTVSAKVTKHSRAIILTPEIVDFFYFHNIFNLTSEVVMICTTLFASQVTFTDFNWAEGEVNFRVYKVGGILSKNSMFLSFVLNFR